MSFSFYDGFSFFYLSGVCVFTVFSIRSVARYTGYAQPLLGLFVTLILAVVTFHLLGKDGLMRGLHFDLLIPACLVFAYGGLLELIEEAKANKKEKEERLSASQAVNPRLLRPKKYGSMITVGDTKTVDRTAKPVAEEHRGIEGRLRILLTHPAILFIGLCASILGIIGFIMQFF